MSSQNLDLTVVNRNEKELLRETSKNLIKDLKNLLPDLIQENDIELHYNILSKVSELFSGFKAVETSLVSSISLSKLKIEKEKAKTQKMRRLSSQKFRLRHSLIKYRKTSWKDQEKKLTMKMQTFQNLWNDSIQSFLNLSKKGKEISKTLTSETSTLRIEDSLNLQEVISTERKALFHSRNLSTDSSEFEKCMAEIEKNRSIRLENPFEVSLEKSFGGWKSELENDIENSFIVSRDDVKHAVEVLEKVKLLDKKNISKLDSIYETLLVNDFDNLQEVLDQVE